MKKIKVIICIAIVLMSIGFVLYGVINNGYLYIGDGWQDTVEEAVEIGMHDPDRGSETFKIAQTIDIYYHDNYAEILYISEAETLVNCQCVKSSRNQWHLQGYTDEPYLEDPSNFVLNGDPEQIIMIPYQLNEESKIVYGWKLSDTASVYVNNKKTQIKKYSFILGGKEWSIDYWWIEDVVVNEYSDIIVTYAS